MKTLYVSDLDGTLLRRDKRAGDFTKRTVNALAARGVAFSYATARSVDTASKVTEGIEFAFPVIVHNGAVIADPRTRRPLRVNGFSQEEKHAVFGAFGRRGLYPVVYSFLREKSRFSFLWEKSSPAQQAFLRTRTGEADDGRARAVSSAERALDGDAFYFACIGEEEKLRPVYEELRGKFRCFFSRDIYTGEPWLEVLSLSASKASAAQELKEMLGCGRIVSFGDGINDLPLFAVSDECYAVENAAPELKAAATAVIPSNEAEGVARWLAEHAAK